MNSDDVRAAVHQIRNGDKNLLDVLSQMIRDIGARRYNYPAQAVQPMIEYLNEPVPNESEGSREGDDLIGPSSVVQHQEAVQEEESGPRDSSGDSVS